jgi:hypothetical protein
MMRLGAFLALIGFGSALLHFTSVQFKLLLWAEPYQPALGLGIGALGAVIIVIKVATSKEHAEEAEPFGPLDQPDGQQQFFGPPPGQQQGPPPHQAQQPPYPPQQQPVPGGQYPPPGPMGPPPGPPPGPQQFGPQGLPAPGQPYGPQYGPGGGQQFGPRR